MYSNTLLFEPVRTKIGHKLRVLMYQHKLSKYDPEVPKTMSNHYFCYHSFENNIGAGKPLRRLSN